MATETIRAIYHRSFPTAYAGCCEVESDRIIRYSSAGQLCTRWGNADKLSSQTLKPPSSSSSCSVLQARVGGNDPPFVSSFTLPHRLTISEARTFKNIHSPCSPRSSTGSSSLQLSLIVSNCLQLSRYFYTNKFSTKKHEQIVERNSLFHQKIFDFDLRI